MILFPEQLEYQWVEELKESTQKQIDDLKVRKENCLSIISRNSIHVMCADDHDDACQEYLEAVWELKDIDDELDKLYYKLEILDK